MNRNQSLGEIMQSQKRNAMKGVALVLALALYAAGIVYTGVHNFNLLSKGLGQDQQLFAGVALLCLEGGAVFLPLAIHFWLAPGGQRTVGYILYGANFFIVVLNTIADYMTHNATTLPGWLGVYAMFVIPATPIMIMVGIAAMFVLDPSKQAHDITSAVLAARQKAVAQAMIDAANRPEINAALSAEGYDIVKAMMIREKTPAEKAKDAANTVEGKIIKADDNPNA